MIGKRAGKKNTFRENPLKELVVHAPNLRKDYIFGGTRLTFPPGVAMMNKRTPVRTPVSVARSRG